MKRKDGINPKEKLGLKKIPLRLVPPAAFLAIAPAMALGGLVKGYGPYNWRDSRVVYSVYHEAMLRHLLLDMDGDESDEEALFSHLGSIMASCAILIDAKMNGTLVDDRHKTGKLKKFMDEVLKAIQGQPENWERLKSKKAGGKNASRS